MVSRHIAQLEQASGSRLFRRTGRGVVLTEVGEQVYPRIRKLLGDADQLADDIRSSKGVPMGDVHLGLLPSTVTPLAGPLSAELRRKLPQVRLHLTEGSSAQLEEWLNEGRLDLSMLLREEDTARADEPVLVRLPLALIVPAKHALAKRKTIAFDEVLRLPLVLPAQPHPLRDRLAQMARQKRLTLNVAAEAGSIRLQHEIVACGGGCAITAATLEPRDRGRLVAIRIVRPVLSRSVVLSATTHRPHTHATREVSRLLLAITPAMLKI